MSLAIEWVEPAPLGSEDIPPQADPLLYAILARRGITAEDFPDFLDASPRPAPDPLLLPGMPEVLERVVAALRSGEAIGIFGDYDTDGVTSAALLTLALRAASAGAQPSLVRLPRRNEGYGLSLVGVDELAAAGVRLLIAVDCGSNDHAAVARAREHGMDVIVLDHHRLGAEPPEEAMIASSQLSPEAPYRNVSAAGIAYLLATALAQCGFNVGNGSGLEPTALLDLAMIGLIGDVSPLTGVNRSLVRDGLRRLQELPRPGLRALCDRAGTDIATLSSTEVAFQISPRLNALGRLGDPTPAFKLLTTTSGREAIHLAEQAEQANRQRKLLQDQIMRAVEASLAEDPAQLDRRVLVVSGSGWQPGIVGLAASKLVDRYQRPVVVLSVDDDIARGSARSIPDFDITTALSISSDLLIRHGGHEQAAGLSLRANDVSVLAEALHEAVERSQLEVPRTARLMIDADIEPARMRLDVARLIQTLGPFGVGNPVPLLRISQLPIRGYSVMGRERQHLKIHTAGEAGLVDAILWGRADRSRELVGARRVDVVGNLESNVWNGNHRVQLRAVDFRVRRD
jgi:single-stranded-DNA-specific exonuclease